MRLRRSDPRMPGISRVRRGTGFSYHDVNGALIVDEAVRGERQGLPDLDATVLMAQRLGATHVPGATQRRRQQLVRAAYADVADYLGNTPAVARSAYVDPRVVDLFHAGVVVPTSVLPRRDTHLPVHLQVEVAVRALLTSAARVALAA